MIFHKSETIEQHHPKFWEDVQSAATMISTKGKGWQREEGYKGQNQDKGGYKGQDSGGYKGKNMHKGGYKGQDKGGYNGENQNTIPPTSEPSEPLRRDSSTKKSQRERS